jgi:methionine biosynthesis protein MetW
MSLRADLAIIAKWIKPDSSILDLGCGDGTLIKYLRKNQSVRAFGLEIDEKNLEACVKDGINVIQADLNEGLKTYFSEDSFDYVIMTQTLQATKRPDLLIDEMLRVGTEGIVTFPNMAHWKARLQIGLGGYMPVTKYLPHEWFNTPNIHLCTVRDFQRLCKKLDIQILQTSFVDFQHSKSTLLMKLFPNLFGEIAIFRICRKMN